MRDFHPGTTIKRGDLDLVIELEGAPMNAASVTYAILKREPDRDTLIGPETRVPANPAIGEYHAAFQIPAVAEPGRYLIRWNVRASTETPPEPFVQAFDVVPPAKGL